MAAAPDDAAENVIPHYQHGQSVKIFQVGIRTLTEGWGMGRSVNIDSDHILYTTDGGTSWQDVTPPQELGDQPLQARAYFLNADTAFVIYFPQNHSTPPENPFVWHTTDRGQTWLAGEILDTGGLEEAFVPEILTFTSQDLGWLSVYVGAGMSHNYTALFQTTDGGQTWSRILDPYSGTGLQTCAKKDIVFADQDNGWAALDCHGLYPDRATMSYTTNGGSSWGDVLLPPPPGLPGLFSDSANCYTHSPHRFSVERGMVGVTCEAWDNTQPVQNFLYLTDDGGQNWKAKSAPEGEFYFYTWMQGYLTGLTIYNTNDRGDTWVPMVDVPWFGYFNFINSQMGWVVAHYQGDTRLMATIDTGATWEQLNPVIVP